MRYHRVADISTRIFILLTALLYIAFMLCDIFLNKAELSSTLKFTSIVLCFIVTVVFLILNPKNKDCFILSFAFLFTVIADVFLLFTDQFLFGVLSFCIVQMIYLYRIHNIAPKLNKYHLWLRLVVTFVTLLIMNLFPIEVDFLICVTVFYFINFVSNLVLLGFLHRKKHQYLNCPVHLTRFFVGMILFILCDVSVGFYNLSYYVNLNYNAYETVVLIASYGMWGFYLPGQVGIALSTKK